MESSNLIIRALQGNKNDSVIKGKSLKHNTISNVKENDHFQIKIAIQKGAKEL